MYSTCMNSQTLQNIHILIPKDELKLLKSQAQRSRKSVGEMIRQAIRKVYGPMEPSKRQAAFQRLAHQKALVMEDWSQVKKDLLKRYE